MDFPDGAYIVADADALSGLSIAAAAGRSPLPIHQVALSLEERVPDEVINRATIVVVQADPASPRSMQRIGELRAARPYMPLIVALHDSDLTLVRSLIRQGVNDVVGLPLDYDQLASALFDAAAGADKATEADAHVGPLYTVIRSIGGSGATTVATHLSAELAKLEGGACLVDLDIQFGTVASFLGVSQQRSIADLLEAHARLDADLMRGIAADRGHGLSVITAPEAILPLEQVDVDQLLRVLALARRTYGSVVLDLPANFTNWSLSTILNSSMVLLVVELSIASLRQAKRRLDLLVDMGFDRRRIRVVVNRVERKLFKPINLTDVETALGVPTLGSVGSDHALVSSAQDQGLLVGAVQGKNKISTDFVRLAEALSAIELED